MNLKRILLLLLTVLMGIVLLSCGGEGNVPVSSDTDAAGTGTAAVPDRGNTQETERIPIAPVETEARWDSGLIPLENPELYCAGPFEPEVYDPDASGRTFRILGAAYSDSIFGVAFGECAVGAQITCTTADGTYTVQSVGGCFSVRFKCMSDTVDAEFTQSYDGQQIGDPISYRGKLVHSSWENDPNWCAMAGFNNQNFFQKMLPDFLHNNLLDDDTVKKLTEKFRSRVEAMKGIGEDGCELICLMIPASMTTYNELVPQLYLQGDGDSKFDQIVRLLREAGVTVLDERETFMAHKYDALPLYYKYDSHWTDYGAYLAYVDLFDYISDRFPAAVPRKFDEFKWKWNYYTGGDMPYYLGLDSDVGGKVKEYTVVRSINFQGSYPAVFKNLQRYTDPKSVGYGSYSKLVKDGYTYETNRPDLPDVYMFRSSYGTQLFDIAAERCNVMTYHTMFSYAFNIAQMKRTQPDYVVYLLSEWNFDEILNS